MTDEPHGSRRPDTHTLTTVEAKAFYDRFGAKQVTQAFYEDHAVDALIAHADFQHAHAIFEFGCGTGRLAARLFETTLPKDCRYVGVDISETMVGALDWQSSAFALKTRNPAAGRDESEPARDRRCYVLTEESSVPA